MESFTYFMENIEEHVDLEEEIERLLPYNRRPFPTVILHRRWRKIEEKEKLPSSFCLLGERDGVHLYLDLTYVENKFKMNMVHAVPFMKELPNTGEFFNKEKERERSDNEDDGGSARRVVPIDAEQSELHKMDEQGNRHIQAGQTGEGGKTMGSYKDMPNMDFKAMLRKLR